MITFTFAECGENHVGNQLVGERAERGLSLPDLEKVQQTVRSKYALDSEIVDLRIAAGLESESLHMAEPAFVLRVKGFVNALSPFAERDDIYAQLRAMPWDTRYYDTRRQRVLNKRARSNNIVADFSQEADYERGMGTVVNFTEAPAILSVIRDELRSWGDAFADLIIAEGNNYHTPGVTGIGWHGDTERSKVVAVRFGVRQTPIVYQWFHRNRTVGKTVEIPLDHGDLYVMSEKAVGSDWKRSSRMTLRHATGAAKYVAPKN